MLAPTAFSRLKAGPAPGSGDRAINLPTQAAHPRQDFSQVLTPRIILAWWNPKTPHVRFPT